MVSQNFARAIHGLLSKSPLYYILDPSLKLVIVLMISIEVKGPSSEVVNKSDWCWIEPQFLYDVGKMDVFFSRTSFPQQPQFTTLSGLAPRFGHSIGLITIH